MIPFIDMPKFLAHAACCLFPSTSEGFGLAGLEALAAGVPLIAGDNEGVRQFVENGRNAILLVREREKRRQQLVKHLNDLIAGKAIRLKLVKQGQKTAAEFSADAMAEKHVEAYLEGA
jgi:glycosyltransferase involved in cell wall biosynthesis